MLVQSGQKPSLLGFSWKLRRLAERTMRRLVAPSSLMLSEGLSVGLCDFLGKDNDLCGAGEI